MGSDYRVNFEVEIDEQKESALKRQMHKLGIYQGDYNFTFNGIDTILKININDRYENSFPSRVEDFFVTELNLAAKSTVLIKEECDGSRNVYAIGPNKRKVQSEYHRREARKHLQTCETSDLKVIHEWLDDRLTP